MLRRLLILIPTLLASANLAYGELRPEQLLLVVNSSMPESGALAHYYAKARGVPAQRIMQLDLPQGQKILPDEFDRRLAQPLRELLTSPAGQNVKCVVLFYGVPLHVGSRVNTPAERDEVAGLRKAAAALEQSAQQLAQDMETLVREAGGTIQPVQGQGIGAAAQRVEAGNQVLLKTIASFDEARRKTVLQKRQALVLQMHESAAAVLRESGLPGAPTDAPVEANQALLQRLANEPRNAQSRGQLRHLVAANGGVFPLHSVLQQQLAFTTAEESDASVDSELALVKLQESPHFRWQVNPMHHRYSGPQVPMVMVMRIDGPSLDVARRMIDDAIAVEAAGLQGTAVFDSRGLPEMTNGKLDGYGWYDETLRVAAKELEKAKVPVKTDDKAQVALPKTFQDVALYCGWYSLQHYVPGSTFNRGAVGYHVASLELTDLHNPLSKEWVPNLLRDGVVATLGAVSEPYLNAFPRPEEFFPLLLSGEVTLAEVYWATVPMMSWKLAMIGDPLYRPYRAKAGMPAESLAPTLRAVVEKSRATPEQ
ncbi:MAG TPA: TIGR03790 family protein [Tepidisphaeraceae bacterium]